MNKLPEWVEIGKARGYPFHDVVWTGQKVRLISVHPDYSADQTDEAHGIVFMEDGTFEAMPLRLLRGTTDPDLDAAKAWPQ